MCQPQPALCLCNVDVRCCSRDLVLPVQVPIGLVLFSDARLCSGNFLRDVLGADVSEPEALPDHGVRTVFINLGNTKLELLHPLGPDSPIRVSQQGCVASSRQPSN